MAFDSRDKRAAAMGSPFMPMMPAADGETLSEADRKMAIGVYPVVIPSLSGVASITITARNVPKSNWLNIKPVTSDWLNIAEAS